MVSAYSPNKKAPIRGQYTSTKKSFDFGFLYFFDWCNLNSCHTVCVDADLFVIHRYCRDDIALSEVLHTSQLLLELVLEIIAGKAITRFPHDKPLVEAGKKRSETIQCQMPAHRLFCLLFVLYADIVCLIQIETALGGRDTP